MRQPPPPPPPTSISPKYLVSLSEDYDASNIGICFQPCKTAHSQECGARIRSIDASAKHTSQWIRRHRMKVGDILYKIDGIVVTDMQHQTILDKLSSCKTLIFEKSQTGHDSLGKEQDKEHAPVPNVDSQTEPSTLVQGEKKRFSPVTSKEMNVHGSMHSSPGGISVERNLLSSIFSPPVKTCQLNALNNSYLSDYVSEMNRDDEQCPDLVEGSGTDSSHDNSMGFSTGDDDADECNDGMHPPMVLGSPTFSYSVTTANTDTLYPMSPIGTKIPMSGSVVTFEEHENGSAVASVRQRYHDSQVLKLKQKYTSYWSPESSHRSTLTDTEHGPIVAHPKNSTKNKTRSCGAVEPRRDSFVADTVDIVPSMGSCSVSTVYQSLPQGQQHAVVSTPNLHQPITSISLSNPPTPLTTNTTYNDIPISMLDYKYVRECGSRDELEKIIIALRRSSPIEFPSLLRTAENRFAELSSIDVNRRGNNVPCNHFHQREGSNGIPMLIHVQSQSDEFSELPCDELRFQDSYHPESGEKAVATEDMNDIVFAHAELQVQMEDLLRDRDAVQNTLSAQIKSLETMLENVKEEMKRKSNDSTAKIELLEKEKLNAETEMQRLRESCIGSSKGVEELTRELQIKESEIGKLAAQVYKEQESKRLAVERAEATTNRLKAQVDSLANQLRVQVKKTATIRTVVELQLRKEYEGRIKRDFEMMEELETKLKVAKENATVLYHENQFMATEFAKVGMRFDSPEEFRGLLKEFAAAEACANALAKALTESETELSVILHENSTLKNKIKNLEFSYEKATTENKTLSEQISSIEKDLENSHLVIDNLQNQLSSYQTRQIHYDKLLAKCKSATELYKSKIEGMKARLAKGCDFVPKETYEKVVESSQYLAKSLEEKDIQIKHLTERIYNLENFIKSKHLSGQKSLSDKNVQSSKLLSPNLKRNMQQSSKGRAALLERMKTHSSKVLTPAKGNRSAFGIHNKNISSPCTTSASILSLGNDDL